VKKFIAAIAILFLASPAFAQINATGIGTVYAKPDCANLSFVVVTENKKALTAHTQNASDSNALMDQLKKVGIEDKDISTTRFAISQKFNYPKDGEPIFAGYSVNHYITVKVHDLKKVGSLIDNSISDSVRVTGISFAISNRNELVEKARLLALTDAKRKANILAKGLDEELGKLMSVQEGVGGVSEPYEGGARLTQESATGRPTSIASGEQAITIQIYGVWDVKK
jgi:uncharacterized protein YggE